MYLAWPLVLGRAEQFVSKKWSYFLKRNAISCSRLISFIPGATIALRSSLGRITGTGIIRTQRPYEAPLSRESAVGDCVIVFKYTYEIAEAML